MTNINPNTFTTRPEIEGTFGVVTSTHWIATAVGMGILERGGNAFDAAVATAFTLQVVEPHLNGPGGDVPVIVYDVKRGKTGSDLRPGRGAGRRDHRALPQRRPRSRARHRAARRLRARHLRDLDDAAARLRHDARRRRAGAGDRLCAERPSAARAHQRHDRDGRANCSANIGRPRPRSICRTTKCRRPDRCSPTRRSPPPTAASSRKPRAPAATASRRSSARANPGRQGFVAEAIDRFCRTQEIMDTSGAAASRRAHRRRHGALDAAHRSAADLRLSRLHRVQDRTVGPGPGDAAAARAAQRLRFRRPRSDRAGLHPSSSSSARSSLTPTAKCFTAIRISSKCRWRRCCPTPTTPNAASSITDKASLELRPGSIEGFGAVVKLRRDPARWRPARANRPWTAWRRRADGRPHGRDARRHRAFRHRRSGRQHGLVDAVGRLAAFLAGHSRARLLPRHARADVLARRRPSGRARPRPAAAHHAVADHGAARRRAVSRLGLARRRRAGSMDHAILHAPCPLPA